MRLNVDIGGGTTKLALVLNGVLAQTAAFHVGGRLLVWDESRRITRLEPRATELLAAMGIEVELGDVLSNDMIQLLGETLART